MKKAFALLAATSAVAAFLLAGCAAREAVHPTTSYVVPDYVSRGVKTIALLPVADRTVSSDASDTVLRLLTPHVSALTAYRFLSQENLVGVARNTGKGDACSQLISGWQRKGEIQNETAVSVGQAVGADALLFTEVFFWTREWIEANTRGASQSQVGIRMVLISTRNGEKLWEVSDDQIVKSAEYDPDSKIGVHVDRSGYATPLYGGIPEPPTLDEVARRVLDSMFRVFP